MTSEQATDDDGINSSSSSKRVSFAAEGGDSEEQDQAPELNQEQRFNKLVLGKEVPDDHYQVIDVSVDHQKHIELKRQSTILSTPEQKAKMEQAIEKFVKGLHKQHEDLIIFS